MPVIKDQIEGLTGSAHQAHVGLCRKGSIAVLNAFILPPLGRAGRRVSAFSYTQVFKSLVNVSWALLAWSPVSAVYIKVTDCKLFAVGLH